MRLAILMNSKAGKLDRAACELRGREIQDAFTKVGVESEIYLCEPAQLTRTAQRLAAEAFDAVVAAGGDGTVSSVAGGLAGTEMPLAVIPLGTLNHFAKDLAMPLELEDAVRAIAEGENAPVDVGEINGRVFINNSSIGLYPAAVLERDVERKQHGRRKLPAMLLACVRVLWRFPLLAVVVSTPDSTLVTKTPFVFFGNNEYTTSLVGLGKREALDEGTLCIHSVRAQSRAKMFWLMVRALLGRPERVPDFETQTVTEASVRCKKKHLHVALDGEVLRMKSPLYYRIRPGALIVRRPSREPAVVPVDEPIAIGGAR